MQTDAPSNLEKYAQSQVFDEHTTPEALRRDHATKAGVWGRIVVTDGALIYLRDGRPGQVITAGAFGTIHPEEPHAVQPKGPVRFHVEFYREPEGGIGA